MGKVIDMAIGSHSSGRWIGALLVRAAALTLPSAVHGIANKKIVIVAGRLS